jgi:hypothetical protein
MFIIMKASLAQQNCINMKKESKPVIASCTHITYYKEHNHCLTVIQLKLKILHEMQMSYMNPEIKTKIYVKK